MKKIIGWFILLSLIPIIMCLPVYFDKPIEGLPHFMNSWNPYLQSIAFGYGLEVMCCILLLIIHTVVKTFDLV